MWVYHAIVCTTGTPAVEEVVGGGLYIGGYVIGLVDPIVMIKGQ